MASEEAMVLIKRVVSRLARHANMEYQSGLPVWDDRGTVVGMSLDCEKQMGTVMCKAHSTYTLDPQEYATEDGIREKTELAIRAMQQNILTSIRPK